MWQDREGRWRMPNGRFANRDQIGYGRRQAWYERPGVRHFRNAAGVLAATGTYWRTAKDIYKTGKYYYDKHYQTREKDNEQHYQDNKHKYIGPKGRARRR
jgi:hypothetical protein